MEAHFKYSCVDFFMTLFGVGSFFFDLGADIWSAGEFYLDGDYHWLGLQLSLIFLSSILVHIFSWIWFNNDTLEPGFKPETRTEGWMVKYGFVFHIVQLGLPLRYIVAIELGSMALKGDQSGHAIYRTCDLSMLRLFETFAESTPQLTLMVYIVIQNNKAENFLCVKIALCLFAITGSVVDYHRSMRSFVPEKNKLGYSSSVVYFLWNLLLIAPRVGAVALFTSIFPPYIGLHFLLLWAALLLWAWAQHTDFMESGPGEWLYRAMVALIWYFSWFNVAEGRTMGRSLIYHTFMAADSGILLGTWYWYRVPLVTDHYVLPLLLALLASYLLGLLLKVTYYKLFHPKIWQPLPETEESNLQMRCLFLSESSNSVDRDVDFRSGPTVYPSAVVVNKRMRTLANNFYSSASTPRNLNLNEIEMVNL
ncbi:XK-related protein 8-like [Polyodon spathula]|uniref:XK-related protein 8-like n=1 Tax=Polyodon spathula TaxID=7913 RepID=UPI001B7DE7B4|nr:XK-related protein 8-like [Polyodon spathula]